jgi:hypothetical protein
MPRARVPNLKTASSSVVGSAQRILMLLYGNLDGDTYFIGLFSACSCGLQGPAELLALQL